MRKLVILAALAAAGLFAQGKTAPLTEIDDLKAAYNGVKTDITAAAQNMPEASYGLHPGTQPRTFGGWVAHVADAQVGICSGIAGTPQNIHADSKTTKADLIAALKQSFDVCDTLYDGITAANAQDSVRSFRGAVPRISALYGNIIHDNECYGSMAVYMRIQELVPPSTEKRNANARGAAKK